MTWRDVSTSTHRKTSTSSSSCMASSQHAKSNAPRAENHALRTSHHAAMPGHEAAHVTPCEDEAAHGVRRLQAIGHLTKGMSYQLQT